MFSQCLTGCFQTPTKKDLQQLSGDHVKIIGMGRHIPGFDDERLQKPKTGTIISTKDICKYFREKQGIHNPKDGKTISDDWAVRNLHIETLTHATNKLKEHVSPDEPYTSVSATEEQLCMNSFEEALSNAGLQVRDLDGIIHNSGSLTNTTCQECLKFWYENYPELQKAQVHVHTSHGCPALLHALVLAKGLLSTNSGMKNLAIVLSSMPSDGYSQVVMDTFLSVNDIQRWLGVCIFSDGAVTLIVSNVKEHHVPMALNIVDVQLQVQPEIMVAWRRNAAPVQGSVVFSEWYLNMHAQSLYASDFTSKFKEMSKKHGYRMRDFQHFVFHQANPRVISRLAEYYKIQEKTCISGKKHANLPGPSLPSDLFERMMTVEMEDQELILGYGMGASMGNASGYFILQVEKSKIEDETSQLLPKSNLVN